jgi:hypothetical protein
LATGAINSTVATIAHPTVAKCTACMPAPRMSKSCRKGSVNKNPVRSSTPVGIVVPIAERVLLAIAAAMLTVTFSH